MPNSILSLSLRRVTDRNSEKSPAIRRGRRKTVYDMILLHYRWINAILVVPWVAISLIRIWIGAKSFVDFFLMCLSGEIRPDWTLGCHNIKQSKMPFIVPKTNTEVLMTTSWNCPKPVFKHSPTARWSQTAWTVCQYFGIHYGPDSYTLTHAK